MKTALSQAAKHFQEAVTRLGEEGGGEEGGGGGEDPSVLRAYYLNCLRYISVCVYYVYAEVWVITYFLLTVSVFSCMYVHVHVTNGLSKISSS